MFLSLARWGHFRYTYTALVHLLFNDQYYYIMKSGIHPTYEEINVQCSCGHTFKTNSTLGKDLRLDVCSECHPFYTGTQKIIDTAGRVDRFNKKYGGA